MRKLRHRHCACPVSMANIEKECRLPGLKMVSLEFHDFQIKEARVNLKANQGVEIINLLATPSLLWCLSI